MILDMGDLRRRCCFVFAASLTLLAARESARADNVETLPALQVTLPIADLPRALPISLDTVFRLAGDQNGQIRIARARLDEAGIKAVAANKIWLPDVSVGPSFYRHEGGIQDFQGNLIHSSYGSLFGGLEVRGKLDLKELTFRKVDAERNLLQKRGELARLNNEQLLEAATAYVDWLAARTALALSTTGENQLLDLSRLAKKLADVDPGLHIEHVRIESELGAQRVLHRSFEQQAESAKLRLLYLLGLDAELELVAVDELGIFVLVNQAAPVADLVQQALHAGPGIAELSQLLALVERLHEKSHDRSPLMPTMEIIMSEGAFGAGPGSSLNWDNRWDLGLHLRWSLNQMADRRNQQRILDSQREQARLSFEELRGKLTLGVRQSVAEIDSSRDQIALATKHIQMADETYRLSQARLRENIKGRSPSEVLLASRSLFAARLSYLNAVRDHDRAQIRLFLLVGAGDSACSPRPSSR